MGSDDGFVEIYAETWRRIVPAGLKNQYRQRIHRHSWKYGGRSLRSEFRLPPANDFSRVIFISICFVNALLTSFNPTSATWAASPKCAR